MLRILPILLFLLAFPSHARETWYVIGSMDTAIDGFLENINDLEAESYGEYSEELWRSTGDLNGDNAPEAALVWITRSPDSWQTFLTIVTPAGSGEYTIMGSDSTLALDGGVNAAPEIRDRVVYLDETVYAEGDPPGNPSVPKQGKYRWEGETKWQRKLVEIQ